jgi:Fe2+ transport system protein FeoA
MTLWNLARNHKAIIEKFLDPIETKHAQRLQDLGMREGEEIICLRWSMLNGPRVYQIGHALIALEKSVAQHITVTPSLNP